MHPTPLQVRAQKGGQWGRSGMCTAIGCLCMCIQAMKSPPTACIGYVYSSLCVISVSRPGAPGCTMIHPPIQHNNDTDELNMSDGSVQHQEEEGEESEQEKNGTENKGEEGGGSGTVCSRGSDMAPPAQHKGG